jgi:hypothetical protein
VVEDHRNGCFPQDIGVGLDAQALFYQRILFGLSLAFNRVELEAGNETANI